MPQPKLTLFTYPDNPRVSKTLIAALYGGLQLDVPDFDFGDGGDNKSAQYVRNAHPLGKVPALQTPEGFLFESNAIARYVARLADAATGLGLSGRTPFESAQVDQWMDFANNELDPAVIVWVGPLHGYMPPNAQNTARARDNISKAFTGLDMWLETRTFLVGERITLADICCVCSILPLYVTVMGPEDRRPYTNLNRWFDTCINQPHFQTVLEPGTLYAGDGVPPAAGAAKEAPKKAKGEQKGKDEKKQEQKQSKPDKKAKAPAPAQEKKPAAAAAGGEDKKLKAVKKEGGKKGQDLAGMADLGTLFQQAMLSEPEGKMDLLEVALEAMNKKVDPEAEERKGGADGVAKILISAGDSEMSVIVHVPEMFTKAGAKGNVRGYEISAADWLDAALSTLPGDGKGAVITQRTPTLAKCTYKNDPEAGRFVLKAKDAVSSASFAFLRGKSLVVDDDDSEEMVFGDDDMPGY